MHAPSFICQFIVLHWRKVLPYSSSQKKGHKHKELLLLSNSNFTNGLLTLAKCIWQNKNISRRAYFDVLGFFFHLVLYFLCLKSGVYDRLLLMETIYRIMKHAELEWTHQDQRVQFLTLSRTPLESHHLPKRNYRY